MSNQPTIGERELFDVAASHFSERPFEAEELEEIWRQLDRRAMRAGEVADGTDLTVADAAAFLDWVAEQGIIETAKTADGQTVYARYGYQLERYRDQAEGLQKSLHRIWRYTGWGIGLTIIPIIYFGELARDLGYQWAIDAAGVTFLIWLFALLVFILSYVGHTGFVGLQKGLEAFRRWFRG